MHDFAKMKLVYNLSRSISTCHINFNKYASRESKFMSKIMRGEMGRRKWYTQNESGLPNTVAPKKPVVPQSNRRNTVLNQIFMEYITDLMATGEVASSIIGKGVEISRVSVTPDFHQVNVFWLAKENEEKDNTIEEILAKAEGPLRHELSQLRVMGAVPIIKFVRDKQYIRFIEIDKRLAKADFGEDFTPTDRTFRMRTTPVLNVKLAPEVWADIEKLEPDVEESELESVEGPLPEMKNDVLGLDHARIMGKIKVSIDKSKAAYVKRSLNILNPLPKDVDQNAQVTKYLSLKERNATFSEFLTKRQLDEKRRRKYQVESDEDLEDELYLFNQQEVDDDCYDGYDADEDEVFDVDIQSKKIEDDKFV